MSNYRNEDMHAKALKKVLNEEQVALWDLVDQTSALFFDSVAGEGCWQSEFSDEQRRMICLRIIVGMVGELFKAESSDSLRLALPPAEPSRRATGNRQGTDLCPRSDDGLRVAVRSATRPLHRP